MFLRSICINLQDFITFAKGNNAQHIQRLDFAKMRDSERSKELVKHKTKVDKRAAEEIAYILRNGWGRNLSSIDLSDNNLSGVKIKKIADALQYGCYGDNLLLSLWGTNLNAKDLTVLADALKNPLCNQKLRLSMGGNNIDDAGASVLADLIKTEKFPDDLELNLSFNDITCIGATKIAEALKSCKKKLKINLLGNEITDAGEKALADAVKMNTNIFLLYKYEGRDLAADHPQNIIHHCYIRNDLICKYPEFAPLIKSLSAQQGFYRPSKISYEPHSLRLMTSLFINNGNHEKLNYEKLPLELKKFIEDTQFVLEQKKEECKIPSYGLG